MTELTPRQREIARMPAPSTDHCPAIFDLQNLRNRRNRLRLRKRCNRRNLRILAAFQIVDKAPSTIRKIMVKWLQT